MDRLSRLPAGIVHGRCDSSRGLTECGTCHGIWCDDCDPAHGPLCPWCHGYGYSTAAIHAPMIRQANHVRNNGGYPIERPS